MTNIIAFLKGKKTYILSAFIALAVFAKLSGIIDEQTFQILIGLLGAGSIASIRSAINN